MKKLLETALGLGLCVSLIGCKKKDNTTKASTTTKVTTKAKTTEKITTKKEKTIVIDTDNPNYESSYTPILSDTLPRIDINVNDPTIEEGHEMDFVTVPNRENKWDYTACNVTVTDENSNITVNNKSAGVKVRGNWTTNYDKKPLRIKFDKKQAMLGLNDDADDPDDGKYKSWLLLAEYKDWSMLRNATAFYLSHLMGEYYVSDFRLVDVYINNQYWGVYLLCEQQEVKDGRVEIAEAEQLEDSTYYQGTDIGYFLEFDGYYYDEDPLQQFTVNYKPLADCDNAKIFSNFQNGFTIKSDIYSTAQRDFIKNYIQNVFNICYSAIYDDIYYSFNDTYTTISVDSSLENSYETISKVIDLDSLVNAYLLADIACDTDIAWSSFFMDVDFSENGDKKLRFEAPWDYDSGFGNTKGCISGEGEYAASILIDATNSQAGMPWFMLFYQADWFKTMLKDKFNGMKEKGYFDKVINNITTMANKYESSFIANYDKWGNVGRPDLTGWEQNEQSRACTTQKESAVYFANWLTKRINSLDKILNNK